MDSNQSARSDIVRLGALMALCLLVGIYLLLTMVLITRDGVFYIDQARRLPRDPVAVAQRYPPGYPFLIWAAHEAVQPLVQNDSTVLWVYVAQGVTLLCRVLALIPLYLLGRMLVGARDTFWALLILVLLPHPAQYGSDVLREWPYLLFLSLGFWLLFWGLRTGRWWVLPLVGLVAGLGYLIRPECVQLVLYGLLGLACCGFQAAKRESETVAGAPRPARILRAFAGLLLMAGFAVPVAPYLHATSLMLPHQLQSPAVNAPPVITSIASQAATGALLKFEVREGELLELPIEASDPDGDALSFSAVSIPMGTQPVYQFRSSSAGRQFWTISDSERKVLLADHSAGFWDYEGIVHYAYADDRARAGLKPVHRFWSPNRRQHFYTINTSEKEAILKEPLPDPWKYEGIVFYAFAEDNHPSDAVPIYRLWNEEQGYHWAMRERGQESGGVIGSGVAAEEIAWYVCKGDALPAGATIEEKTFRWRPGPEGRGDHPINILVGDGQVQSCQHVMIHVVPAGSGQATCTDISPEVQHAGVSDLPTAADEVFDALAEDLMVFFLVPWALGFYCRLRYEARTLERVLMMAVILVGVGLMLTRYVWLEPVASRRYSLALVVLTVFYIPTGLTLMSTWLGRILGPRGKREIPSGGQRPLGFFVLAAVGLAICVVRLLPPLRADKMNYRTAAAWLRENTQTDDVIAVPDSRIGFYAERPMVIYEQDADPREVDYVVSIGGDDATPSLTDSQEVYALEAGREGDKAVVIYRTARPRP